MHKCTSSPLHTYSSTLLTRNASLRSYQMEWNFPTAIPPSNKCTKVYVEFDEGLFIDSEDDAGSAVYEMAGTNTRFTFQATAGNNKGTAFNLGVSEFEGLKRPPR